MNLKTGLCKIAKMLSDCILDIFYPKRCIMCNSLINIGKSISICHLCKKTLKDHARVIRDNDKYFEEAVCSFEYEGNIKNAMSDFKFKGLRHLAGTFAYSVYNNVKNRKFFESVEYICPVPLHPMRDREYNQSELIAGELSKYSKHKMVPDLLIKIKNIPPLSKMDYAKRSYMIKSAFVLNMQYDVSGKTICLIDDIYTTSTTVNECARILKINGAEKVYVLCPCYTKKGR